MPSKLSPETREVFERLKEIDKEIPLGPE